MTRREREEKEIVEERDCDNLQNLLPVLSLHQSGLKSISVRQANLSMKPFCEKKCPYEVCKLQNWRKAEKIFVFQRVQSPNLIKRNHF